MNKKTDNTIFSYWNLIFNPTFVLINVVCEIELSEVLFNYWIGAGRHPKCSEVFFFCPEEFRSSHLGGSFCVGCWPWLYAFFTTPILLHLADYGLVLYGPVCSQHICYCLGVGWMGGEWRGGWPHGLVILLMALMEFHVSNNGFHRCLSARSVLAVRLSHHIIPLPSAPFIPLALAAWNRWKGCQGGSTTLV